MTAGKQVQGTQSFARSIALLQQICDRGTPPNLQDLLSECDLTRPTLYRVLAGLEAEGLITQTLDRRYKPGARLINMARASLEKSDIRDRARDALIQLRNETGETVHLAVRSGAGLVYIDKIESLETVRMSSTIGTFVPLHSTGVGKAYLAALPTDDANALIDTLDLAPITRFTTTDPDVLRRQIATARAQGYVFDDQENEENIACFGGAIVDTRPYPIAAISVSVPLFRLREDPQFYAGPLLKCLGALRQSSNSG